MPTAILRPDALGTYDQWNGVAPKGPKVDPGDPLAHDEAATVIGSFSGVPHTQTFTVFAASIPPNIAIINSITFYVRGVNDGVAADTIAPFWRFGGNDAQANFALTASAYTNFNTLPITTRPVVGGAWQPSDLSTLEIGVQDVAGSGSMFVTSIWAILDYSQGGSPIESYRSVASQRLRLRRLPSGLIEAVLPTLEYLDQEMLDLMLISHPDLPGPTLRGADIKNWQAWPVRKISSSIDWATGSERVILRDEREILTTWWDVGKSLKATSTYADGLARLDAGNTRAWARASSAWTRTPNVTIVQTGNDSDKIDKDGELFEGAATNEIIHSGFKQGAASVFTGWTESGSGTNGSDVVEDLTELLFDPDLLVPGTGVLRSVKFTAGNPHASDLLLTSTATASIVANTICRFSVWHKDDNSLPLFYRIQRGFDSRYWRDSDQTWQVGVTYNELPTSAVRARDQSKQIDVGTSATTLTFALGLPNATPSTPGRVNHLYHVQLEQKRFVSSTILTETLIYARVADKLTITSAQNAPVLHWERSTWRCKVQPLWLASEVATVNKTVFYRAYDSNNYEWFYFDGVNARWVYELKASGVVYRAVKAASPVPGTVYSLATRKTSAFGELDLSPHTISVFVDGVKGTDAVGTAIQVTDNALFEIGSKAGAENLDGYMWMMEANQQALSDASVARA